MEKEYPFNFEDNAWWDTVSDPLGTVYSPLDPLEHKTDISETTSVEARPHFTEDNGSNFLSSELNRQPRTQDHISPFPSVSPYNRRLPNTGNRNNFYSTRSGSRPNTKSGISAFDQSTFIPRCNQRQVPAWPVQQTPAFVQIQYDIPRGVACRMDQMLSTLVQQENRIKYLEQNIQPMLQQMLQQMQQQIQQQMLQQIQQQTKQSRQQIQELQESVRKFDGKYDHMARMSQSSLETAERLGQLPFQPHSQGA